MEISKRQPIILQWLAWHFFQMPADLVLVWKNYIFFVAGYFSIPLLLSTLLSPWRHTAFASSKRFDMGEFFGNLIANAFSRVIGAVLRLALILAGLVAQVIVIALGALAIIFCLVVPFIVLGLIIFAIYV